MAKKNSGQQSVDQILSQRPHKAERKPGNLNNQVNNRGGMTRFMQERSNSESELATCQITARSRPKPEPTDGMFY